MTSFVDRLQGRLDRLGVGPDEIARAAGLSTDALRKLLDGQASHPRGKKLVRLADALATSVAYLIGLDPDAAVPEEFLQEDQGAMGMLAGDEDALLRAYRRLDVSSRGALLQVVLKMSPEPELLERRGRQLTIRV